MNLIISHTVIAIAANILGTGFGWLLRGAMKEEGEKKVRRFKANHIISVGVVVLSLVSLVGMVVAINDYREAADCQIQYNIASSKALKERSDAASADRQATRTMLASVMNTSSTPQQRLDAIKNWDKALEDADKKRDDNPILINPDCSKGIS